MVAVISRSTSSRSRRSTSARAASTARRRNSCSSRAPTRAATRGGGSFSRPTASSSLSRRRPTVPQLLADGVAAASDRLLPAQGVGQAAELLGRLAGANVDARRRRQVARCVRVRSPTRGGDGPVPRSAGPIAAGIGRSGRTAATTVSLARGQACAASRPGATRSRQRRGAAVSSCSAWATPLLGRGRLLSRGGARRVSNGSSSSSAGQVLFGRRQPGGDRTAACAELPVQHVAVVGGLLDLQLEHADLLLAGVELPRVGAFQHDLAQPGGDAAGRPSTARAQPSEPVIEVGMNRPASTSTTPTTKIVPSPASVQSDGNCRPSRRRLCRFERPAGSR